MNDLEVFVAMLVRADVPHNVGPAAGIGGAVRRVEILEQNRQWKLAAVFDVDGKLINIGTWLPPMFG